MKFKQYFIIGALGLCVMMSGCGGSSDSSNGNYDGHETEESYSSAPSYNFEDVNFNTQASVMGFMGGKTFSDGTTTLRLSGNRIEMRDYSGSHYGTITGVRIIGSNKALIETYFQFLSATVNFGLFVDDNHAYIIDSQTHSTFNLE